MSRIRGGILDILAISANLPAHHAPDFDYGIEYNPEPACLSRPCLTSSSQTAFGYSRGAAMPTMLLRPPELSGLLPMRDS